MKYEIDLVLVAVNLTSGFVIEEEGAPLIEEIRGVYMLDRNQVTHCCEVTPSYWLEWLYCLVVWNDQDEELDEEAKGQIYEKYEHQLEDNGGHYTHCGVIDRFIKEYPDRVYLVGKKDFDDSELTHDEVLDANREHYSCNWIL